MNPRRRDETDDRLHDQSLDAARHLVSIVDGSQDEVIGSTYAHIKEVVDTVHGCGYLEAVKQPSVPIPATTPEPEEHLLEEPVEEVVFVPTESQGRESAAAVPPVPAVPLIPHPVPQNVPAPNFPSVLTTPVTLQQVEHAYFAQQYGHPKPNGAPPVAEVFGPQNFIFLQESEIETPETARQTSPCPVSPASIPSQTFTNQNFSLPSQHFNPEIANGPHVSHEEIPPAAHYPDVNESSIRQHVSGFPSVAVPPVALPLHGNLPPPQHVSIPAVHPPLSSYRHPVPVHVTYEPADSEIVSQMANEPAKACDVNNDADYSEWAETNNDSEGRVAVNEPLEINQWNPADGEGGDTNRSRSDDKYRQRRRGGGGGNPNPGGYRQRGNYQNGRGSYYRNEGHHSKMNGDSDNNEREYRYDNSKNNYRDGNGGGFKSRGPSRMHNGPHNQQSNGRSRPQDNRGPPRPSQSQNGTSNNKPYYSKRQGNGHHFESRSEGKQQFTQ